MAYALFPLLIVIVFTGFLTQQRDFVDSQSPNYQMLRADSSGLMFLLYRQNVFQYLQSHPGFLGVVPVTALDDQFSDEFLSKVGNQITATSAGTGRVVTCFANFPSSALNEALLKSENDASFGIASGGSWKSVASGAIQIAVPLATSVPDGFLVSVVQIGV